MVGALFGSDLSGLVITDTPSKRSFVGGEVSVVALYTGVLGKAAGSRVESRVNVGSVGSPKTVPTSARNRETRRMRRTPCHCC